MNSVGKQPQTSGTIYLTEKEIFAARPCAPSAGPATALQEARDRLLAAGQWSASQVMGRRWPIGCVALEITQRCNLDCTACYLSEHSEAVKDLPLEEVFRRIDMILRYYGPNTDVQVTGGDPTLRKREELVAIVRRIRDKGMRPTLMTNGIRAKRDLLQELANAGLVDVAFHVDLTQRRRNYDSERALNAVRQEYIERARGLPLCVHFNTTVTAGNFAEIPEVVRFFVRNSDAIRLASFQLQADTGRGELGRRAPQITMSSVRDQIELGAGTSLSFDTAHIGHSSCNRYAMTLVTNGRVYDVLADQAAFNEILERTAHLPFDRQNPGHVLGALAKGILTSPALAARVAVRILAAIWNAKADLLAARGRVHKLSFFVHDFMDACRLESDRVDSCVFAAATKDGPICMCLHNAKRDAFILDRVELDGGRRIWNPVSGEVT